MPEVFAPLGLRQDGTPKGVGYMGPLRNKATGELMTEMSVGVEIDGQEMLIPSIVPTLDRADLEYMMAEFDPRADQIPERIMKKAVDHAMQRLREGQSVWAD